MAPAKIIQKKKKKDVNFEKMSTDNFLRNMDASDTDEDFQSKSEASKTVKVRINVNSKNVVLNQKTNAKTLGGKNKKSKNQRNNVISKEIVQYETDDDDDDELMENVSVENTFPEKDTDDESDQESIYADEKSYNKALGSLATSDPELFKFLSKNDKKLLKGSTGTAEMGSEDDDSDSEAEENDDFDHVVKNDLLHKPPNDLELASDESDFDEDKSSDGEEESNKSGGPKRVTLKMLQVWQEQLSAEIVEIRVIRSVIDAFNSALSSISTNSDEVNKSLWKYRVEGAAIFNGVLQLCVLHLEAAVKAFLGISSTKSMKDIGKLKKFTKIKNPIRTYLMNLTKLLENVTSEKILTVLLKHLHQFSSVLPVFQNITKPILKCLISIWSTSSYETVRVLSFLCILKITRDQQQQFLNNVLKAMYLAYVKNSKFVSPNSFPAINFMRRSLTEIFTLDLNTSYQHCFLYIRQLAIHLRNAVTLQKKDSKQMVYNWQFIHSLKLWGSVLATTNNKQQLQPLIYPLVSITIGVIKLIPNAQYFPLRFHCVQILIELSTKTDTFIPILPFVVETLNSQTFMKPHKKVSMRPLNFGLVLRLQKSQLEERGFRDAVVDNVYGAIIEILANESSNLAYPDLIIPCVVALRHFLQNEKNLNYVKKIKQLLDKIIENSKYIEQERKNINFNLKNTSSIRNWENEMKNKGTPLQAFYDIYKAAYEKQLRRMATDIDSINEHELPTLLKRNPNKTTNKRDGPVELFPSSGSDSEFELEKPLPNKVRKRALAKVPTKAEAVAEPEENDNDDGNHEDIVENLDLNDW